ASILERWRVRRPATRACGALLVGLLTMLSWQRCRVFASDETLWRDTLARNPTAWVAHYNLANELRDRGALDDAIAHYTAAVALKPDYAQAYANLGVALVLAGRPGAAVAAYQRALTQEPERVGVRCSLGEA